MYAREITSEEIYALQEARRIIQSEQRHKREITLYFFQQKLFGVVSIGASLAGYAILKEEMDGFILILMISIGIYLLTTKKRIIGGKM